MRQANVSLGPIISARELSLPVFRGRHHGAHLHQQATEDRAADGSAGPSAYVRRPAARAAMDIPAQKAALRKTALASRRKSAESAPAAGKDMAGLFFSVPDLPAAGVIAAYWPIRDEIDAVPLMRRLVAAGRTVVLPLAPVKAKPLRFAQWRPGDTLVEGRYGVLVPAPGGRELTPDVLIVPLLAFDRSGGRLGYGGGFYDRTLEDLRRRRDVPAVGVAYAGQEVGHVPTDARDQKLDWIVTEKAAIRTRAFR